MQFLRCGVWRSHSNCNALPYGVAALRDATPRFFFHTAHFQLPSPTPGSPKISSLFLLIPLLDPLNSLHFLSPIFRQMTALQAPSFLCFQLEVRSCISLSFFFFLVKFSFVRYRWILINTLINGYVVFVKVWVNWRRNGRSIISRRGSGDWCRCLFPLLPNTSPLPPAIG